MASLKSQARSRSQSQSPPNTNIAQPASYDDSNRDRDRDHNLNAKHPLQLSSVQRARSRSKSPNPSSTDGNMHMSMPKRKKHSSSQSHSTASISASSSKQKKKSSSSVTSKSSKKSHKSASHQSSSSTANPNANVNTSTNQQKKRRLKTVPPPTQEVLAWVMGMSQSKQRHKIAKGMRVKVRFLKPTVTWYGGLVAAKATDGTKIRIKYDDGTKEVADFPDKEIVVDANGNGEHRDTVAAAAFKPKALPFSVSISSKKKKHMKKVKSEKTKRDKGGYQMDISDKDEKIIVDVHSSAGSPVEKLVKAMHLESESTISNEKVADRSRPMELESVEKDLSAKITPRGKTSVPNISADIHQSTNMSNAPQIDQALAKFKMAQGQVARESPEKEKEASSKPIKDISTDGKSSFVAAVQSADSKPFQSSETKKETLTKAIHKAPNEDSVKNNNSDISDRESFKPNNKVNAPKTLQSISAKPGTVTTMEIKLASVLPKFAQMIKPIASNNAADAEISTNVPMSAKLSVTPVAIEKLNSPGTPVPSPEKKVAKDSHDATSKKHNTLETNDACTSRVNEKSGLPVDHKESGEHAPHMVASDITQEERNGLFGIIKSANGSDEIGVPKQVPGRHGRRPGRKPQQKLVGKDGKPGEVRGKKRRKEKEDGRKSKKNETKQDIEGWVLCENCEKWRLIPSVKDLPEKWYCKMNLTDPKRNFCEAAEQTPEEVEKERKKAKKAAARKLGRSRSLSPANATPKKMGTSQKTNKDRDSDQDKRESPSIEKSIGNSESGDDSQSGGMKKKRISSQTSFNEDASSENEASTPQPRRGVGRRGRRSNEEKGDGRGKRGKKQKEKEQDEWVQCNKCDKWRRLPRHIPAESMPDKWFCSMNTWDPRSASCAVMEDYKEDLKPKENTILPPQSFGGKLTYRNLIRRPTRSITERMRAAESIFSSHAAEAYDDQSGSPPVVLYANSSMFQQKLSYHRMAEQQEQFQKEEERMPLFTLLSHTQLWKDLSSGFGPGNNDLSLSSLTSVSSSARTILMNQRFIQMSSLKPMVYHALGNKQLSASDILLECQCREWENNKWADLRASVTYESICAVMNDLVKDGSVNVVSPAAGAANSIFSIVRYARANTCNNLERKRGIASQSRCMKLSKPWKRARLG